MDDNFECNLNLKSNNKQEFEKLTDALFDRPREANFPKSLKSKLRRLKADLKQYQIIYIQK